MTDHIISEFAMSIYGGVLEEQPWTSLLHDLQNEFNLVGCAIILSPPDSVELSFMNYLYKGRNDTADGKNYTDVFFAVDPFINLPEGKVTTMHDFVGSEAIFESEYYKSFGQTIDAFYIAGFDVTSKTGFKARLRVCREPDQVDFTQHDLDALSTLIPHFRKAIELYERIDRLRTERQVFTNVLDQLTMAAFILNSSGEIVRMNKFGNEILNSNIGIRVRNKRLMFSSQAINVKVRDAIKSAKQKDGCSPELIDVIAFEDPITLHTTNLAMRPIASTNTVQSKDTPILALFATDPLRPIKVNTQAIATLYGLTPTEAKLAITLSNFSDLKKTAVEMNITHNTARSHLRSIYSKMDIKRQSELLRLISRAGA